MLTVLVLARREYGSSVNTLIINQCTMDLVGCLSVLIVVVRSFIDSRGHIMDSIICGVFSSTAVMAEKIGLVIITLERYFKIVHAIAHRKYYRDWMTKVGVALPWIGAMCLMLIPAIASTKVTKKYCLERGVWLNADLHKVSNFSKGLSA